MWLAIGAGLLVAVVAAALLCRSRRRGDGRTSKDSSGYMDAIMQQRRLQSAQVHQYGENTKRGSLGIGILPTILRRDSSKGASVGATRAPAWGLGSAGFPDPPDHVTHVGSEHSENSALGLKKLSKRGSSDSVKSSSRSSLKPENSALFSIEL